MNKHSLLHRFRLVFLFFALLLLLVVAGSVLAKRTSCGLSTKKDFIKVCGKVFYSGYQQQGKILISWREKLYLCKPCPENKSEVVTSSPATYCVNVPKNIRSFFIVARYEVPTHGPRGNTLAYFVSKRIYTNPRINQIIQDVNLTSRSLLMGQYKGPTVKISGRLISKGVTNGIIAVAVESAQNRQKVILPADIAKIIVREEGKYSLEVPVDSKEVYLYAILYPNRILNNEMKVEDLRCYDPKVNHCNIVTFDYEHNPLMVTDADISNVDIDLK